VFDIALLRVVDRRPTFTGRRFSHSCDPFAAEMRQDAALRPVGTDDWFPLRALIIDAAVELVRSWPKPSANPAHPLTTCERWWRPLLRAVASSLIAIALLRLPVATDTLPSARLCNRRSGSA